MNSLTIKGRLTKAPEVRTWDNGNTVCSFSVAVDRRFKNKSGEYETDFFNVSAWNKTGEFVSRYFDKGQEILIQGSMQSRKHADDDGTNRTYWEVRADSVEFCGRRETGRSSLHPVRKMASSRLTRKICHFNGGQHERES